MTQLALTPAACYPVYPALAARGPVVRPGITVDPGAAVIFRHEPSEDPTRWQFFHMRELVRAGDPEEVIEWRDGWLVRGLQFLRDLGLAVTTDVAADPFFGRSGKLLAASQREQALKYEIHLRIVEDQLTALASFNCHQGHFATLFGLSFADGGLVHTACLGFGHERIVLGLLRTHGLDVDVWPAEVADGSFRDVPGLGMLHLFGLDPASYRPHAVHQEGRVYQETNCYTDILVELIHARGDEPLAALGCTLEIAFEGDQWTFFKPDPADLWSLFGIDIHEMQPYLDLALHIAEQLKGGRSMTVEVDAWFLPDTLTTSYRREHVKTSIAVEAIDPGRKRSSIFTTPRCSASLTRTTAGRCESALTAARRSSLRTARSCGSSRGDACRVPRFGRRPWSSSACTLLGVPLAIHSPRLPSACP